MCRRQQRLRQATLSVGRERDSSLGEIDAAERFVESSGVYIRGRLDLQRVDAANKIVIDPLTQILRPARVRAAVESVGGSNVPAPWGPFEFGTEPRGRRP